MDELDETSGVAVQIDEEEDEAKSDVLQELKEDETDAESGEEVTYEEILKTADGVNGSEVTFLNNNNWWVGIISNLLTAGMDLFKISNFQTVA